MVNEDDKNAEKKAQDGMLDSFSRSGNILISRALGSTLGCVALGAVYLMIPTLDKMVASWDRIRLAEVACIHCSTDLNYCSSDLKQCRAELLECRK